MTAEDSSTQASPDGDASVQASVVPNVTAAHDANLTSSLAGVVNSQGDADLNQSGAGAVIAQGAVGISQGGAAAIVSRSVAGESMGTGIVVANDVRISRGWIGVVASPNVEISDDSRVLIDPRAALIIAVAIFGVFGLAVVMAAMFARRAMQWRPKIPMPSIQWRRARG
ncbi:MAG: hypothetical protein HY876_02635 [Coriobacteriales bacterium]|nr:hypothetical protein [Coriobacteriales bacterium]